MAKLALREPEHTHERDGQPRDCWNYIIYLAEGKLRKAETLATRPVAAALAGGEPY